MREGWVYKKLGEVCEIICGQDYKKVESPYGKYPIYGTGGIMGYANEFKCPAYSVIVGRKGNINNPIYVEENFWNVDTAFGVVPSKVILASKFFFYFCKNYDFTKHNVAVTIPSLRRIDLLKIPIPVPPLSEQQRIVSELDLLSSIIEKKKAQLKEYDQLAQSIFFEMFGDPVTNEKGWEVKKLGDICETTSGGTPSKNHSEYYEGGMIPWLRSGEVCQGFIYNTEMFITEEGLKCSSAKMIPVDSVAIAMYGATVGQVGIIKSPMCTNQAICSILPNDYFIPIFLYHFLLSKKSDFLKVAVGGAQPNISQTVIKQTIIGLPPLSLQQFFASKIEAIERQKALVQQSITETETLFNSRMDYWFS